MGQEKIYKIIVRYKYFSRKFFYGTIRGTQIAPKSIAKLPTIIFDAALCRLIIMSVQAHIVILLNDEFQKAHNFHFN